MTFEITDQRIEPEALKDLLSREAAGAFVSFEGWVRDHNDGQPVTALEYEAHAPVANKEGQRILEEAIERFDVLAALGRHRVGQLEIGECAVWVGVSAAHRGVAFDACRYIIDELKQRVPIWKKEHYVDGPSGWINSQTGATSSEGDKDS
jgi:molybdopterin synthase catalytic subunit